MDPIIEKKRKERKILQNRILEIDKQITKINQLLKDSRLDVRDLRKEKEDIIFQLKKNNKGIGKIKSFKELLNN